MSHDQNHTSEAEPARAASQLTESLTQAAQNQRALLQEMSSFAKAESMRFFNLRLERNEAALEKMQHCVGLPGLIGVQQEWLRDFVQDLIGQNMRMAGVLRGVTHDTVTAATAAAKDMQDGAQDMAHQAEQQFQDMTADAHNHLADDERAYSDVQH
jgi:ribosomal protein L12E/L44/L45/RPP1/RPP2